MALRGSAADALCLVELRGFEPLTPCMPYTACRHEHCCSEPSPLVNAGSRLTARYRCCPLMSPGPCPRHAPGALGYEAAMSVKPCWVGPAIAAGSAPREPRR